MANSFQILGMGGKGNINFKFYDSCPIGALRAERKLDPFQKSSLATPTHL